MLFTGTKTYQQSVRFDTPLSMKISYSPCIITSHVSLREHRFIVTAVETQGRYGNGTGREFVSEYMIDYLRPGSKWIRYRNRSGHTLMTANQETTTAVRRVLVPPIVASRIRIVPHSKQMRTICLRMELYGCLHRNGLLFYSTLPAGSRVGGVDFRDKTFENSDLYTETGIKRGLGLLSDGYVSENSPFDGNNPNGSWIGWSKHHTDGIVTLLFEFDQLRVFSGVLLAAYGRINSIDVIFSQDGTNFSLSSQISSLSRSPSDTQKRNDLHIPLHKRMAKKIRVTLSFVADWLFLTEIHFNSVLFNESSVVVDVRSNTVVTPTILGFTVSSSALLLSTIVLCLVIHIRRQKSDNKVELFENGIRRNLIITHVSGKSSTEIQPSSQEQLLPNFYASAKTTCTSLSSKSASPKLGPATWNDFHFPPPPSISDDRIYSHTNFAQPSITKHQIEEEYGEDSLERPSVHAANKNGDIHQYDSVPVREHAEKSMRTAPSSLCMSKELGRGKHTIIRECVVPKFGKVAHKTIRDVNNLHGRNAILDEIKMLSSINSPHVIRLLSVDVNDGLLLEFAPNGNVRQYLRSHQSSIPINKLLGLCADVCEGMRHLESLGIVHGHLTPNNIVLDENLRAKPVIVDLGFPEHCLILA